MSNLDYPISILVAERDKLFHPNLIKEISEAIILLKAEIKRREDERDEIEKIKEKEKILDDKNIKL